MRYEKRADGGFDLYDPQWDGEPGCEDLEPMATVPDALHLEAVKAFWQDVEDHNEPTATIYQFAYEGAVYVAHPVYGPSGEVALRIEGILGNVVGAADTGYLA